MPLFVDDIAPKICTTTAGGRRTRDTRSFAVYPVTQLPLLLEEIHQKKQQKAGFNPEATLALRFIVDLDYRLWFAREGLASNKTPSHHEMTGMERSEAKCITAGIANISYKDKKLVYINNQSGDFRPDFNSLKWILIILKQQESKLPFSITDMITLQKICSSGRIEPEEIFKWSDIKDELSALFTDQTEFAQSEAIKTVSYAASLSRKTDRSHFFDVPFTIYDPEEDDDPELKKLCSPDTKSATFIPNAFFKNRARDLFPQTPEPACESNQVPSLDS